MCSTLRRSCRCTPRCRSSLRRWRAAGHIVCARGHALSSHCTGAKRGSTCDAGVATILCLCPREIRALLAAAVGGSILMPLAAASPGAGQSSRLPVCEGALSPQSGALPHALRTIFGFAPDRKRRTSLQPTRESTQAQEEGKGPADDVRRPAGARPCALQEESEMFVFS